MMGIARRWLLLTVLLVTAPLPGWAGTWLLDENHKGRFGSVHYRGCSETFIQSMRARTPHEGVLGLALSSRELQVSSKVSFSRS